MLNKRQIQLVQMAVRGAGLRGKGFEGRYRLLLGQYTLANGRAVTSCRELTNEQLDDLLAICESLGWRHPGKVANYYRTRAAAADDGLASYAQIAAIRHLAGDLGWTAENLKGMLMRMAAKTDLTALRGPEAWKIIEALKAMVLRGRGSQAKGQTLADVAAEFKGTTACPI
jgi:hypothetical protein